MPSTEQVYESSLLGAVNDFLDEKRQTQSTENKQEFLSILEFIDRFNLFPYGLYPVQKFIVKLYYTIPLDNDIKTITITDKFSRKTLYKFTEIEYLKYLYDQGRCNLKEQDGKTRNELILVLGRRSGKSALSAIFSAYEVYKLLVRGHPQAYYGLPSGSEIFTFCIANDKDQASIVFNDMQGHISKIDFFKKSIFSDTQTYMRFQTENDRVLYGTGKDKNGKKKGKGTIKVTFKSSVAKGIRGRGTILMILDELAHFVEEGGTSAEKIYKAIVPSTATFSPKDPNNKFKPLGPTDGKIISISSPDTKEGFFFHLYQLSLSNSKASQNMLMIQAPTWEVNPTLSPEYYEVEYHKSPSDFYVEHGAQFSDRVRGWIEDSKDLTDCIDVELKPMDRGIPRKMHFVGFDLGLVDDGSSVAITHINNGKIELAYHEIWYAGKKWEEINPHLKNHIVPYSRHLQDVKRLDMMEVADWLQALSKKFYMHVGLFDQWAGIVFETELHKRKLQQFEMRNFFKSHSSQMYRTFKMFMYNNQIRLYDRPLPQALEDDSGMVKHSPIIQELLELQGTAVDKHIVVVEAPKVAGKHDDMSDALARSILLASEFIKENPQALTLSENSMISSPDGRRSGIRGYDQFHRARSKLHGPPNRNRISPRRR